MQQVLQITASSEDPLDNSQLEEQAISQMGPESISGGELGWTDLRPG